MTLITNLERLRAAATLEAVKSDKCIDWSAYVLALVNAAPELLAVVKAAEAYLEYVPNPNDSGPAKHSAHAVAAIELRAALAALEGKT